MREKEIRHHNSISYGKLEEFELRELKLFLALMTEVKKDVLVYTYNSVDVKQFINMGDQSYKAFEKIISNLQKRRIVIFENENKYTAYNIISLLKLDKKEKSILVKYNQDFFPLINDFNNNFCKYKLKNIEPLKSKYSIIFYMLSKANLFKKKYFLSVEEVREKIGQKIRINNLDARVFEPMIEEINRFTDINLAIEKEYTNTVGRGRSTLVGYTFVVNKKIIEVSEELKKAVTKAKKNIYILKSKVLNKETIQILLDEVSEEELISGLNFAYKKINKDFTKLEYLKKVILSNDNILIKDEIEILEKEKEIKILDISNIENAVILDKEETFKEEILEMEETLIEYLVKTENVNKETLISLKKKSSQIYENTLLRAYKEIKKEF